MAGRKERETMPGRRVWVDIEEAAAYAGMGVRTLRAKIASGSLPAYRVPDSHMLRIDLRDVDAWLTSHPVPTGGL